VNSGLGPNASFAVGAMGPELISPVALLAPFVPTLAPASSAVDSVRRDENPEPSSELLAEHAKAGCLDSFEQLVERYGGQVFHFLRQLTGNHHDAEDLTQETFVRAYRSVQRFDSSYSFAAWLFTIARRTGASHFRSARAFEELPEQEESAQETPATTLEKKDERASIWKLVRTLKPKQAEAIWLRYAQGFSVAELARIMGTNQIYIKVLLHRGRANLLKTLTAQRFGFAPKTTPEPGNSLGQANRESRTEPL
jgi:RNA polymerase sigma-70 factor, ECF subfamily